MALLLAGAVGVRLFALASSLTAETPGAAEQSPLSSPAAELHSAAPHSGEALAWIEIPRLGLTTQVLEGTEEATLLRGVGHVEGTPLPGEEGNIVLAAHRDLDFRTLRGVHIGDAIRLTTHLGSRIYRVTYTQAVAASNTRILSAEPDARLTLLTWFPYSDINRAPRRYIVYAVAQPAQAAAQIE